MCVFLHAVCTCVAMSLCVFLFLSMQKKQAIEIFGWKKVKVSWQRNGCNVVIMTVCIIKVFNHHCSCLLAVIFDFTITPLFTAWLFCISSCVLNTPNASWYKAYFWNRYSQMCCNEILFTKYFIIATIHKMQTDSFLLNFFLRTCI